MDPTTLLASLKPEAKKINTAMQEDIRVIQDGLLREVLEHTLFNGGKRVRPLLSVFCARLCGCMDDALYNLAIAFEYLHVATLLHDDVIDHADQRRGKQTVNTIWGRTPAILAGDYLHARSMFLIGSLGGRQCLDIICRATAAMVEGEFLQMHNAGNADLSATDYFKIIEGKTAILIAAVCEIGAVFSGATVKQREALRSYGSDLGQAFQVVDDLLDYLGDSASTGKAVGNDFIEGKMTLPLIHALGNAEPRERDLVQSLLNGPEAERRDHIVTVRQLIEKYDGFGYAKQQAKMLVDASTSELDIFTAGSTSETKAILIGLADYVLTRKK
jgi:octaprenyl-diphosphate synthase